MSNQDARNDSEKRSIETDFPVDEINRNAQRENYARGTYRPLLIMHKWFARRPGTIFRNIILHALSDVEEDIQDRYLEEFEFQDDTVVDPFMGGGTTIYEALRTNAQVLGTDLNPVAWFITKKGTDSVDLDAFDEAYNKIKESVAADLKSYYTTPCRHCSDDFDSESQGQSTLGSFDSSSSDTDNLAEAMNYFWVMTFPCVNESCDSNVNLFKSYVIAEQRSENDSGVWVYCPACADVFVAPDENSECRCDCGHSFVPSKGNYDDGDYYCHECGQDYDALSATERFDKPEFEMYAVEYYCDTCGIKEYAALTDFDYSLYNDIVTEFENQEKELPIPEQKIPYGHNTSERNPVTSYFEKWRDMFNERQLLAHSKIFDAILDIESANEREYMLLVASHVLNYKNMLTIYDTQRSHHQHLYLNHAIIPRVQPAEGDIWGQTFGRSTFKNQYENVRDALEYKLNPKEFMLSESGEVEIRQHHNEIIREEDDAILSTSAESLPLDDNEVSAVITDPPYYDNIQYAELSDFFYVWLRKVLWKHQPEKKRYSEFESELTPKIEEIIKNPERSLSSADFEQGLRRAFEECNRVLQSDGIMCFTFHHKDPEAWEKVLEAAMSAGFYVSAAWLLDSEMENNMHILNKQGIKYDILIVCRDREEPSQISWDSLEDQIHTRVTELINEYNAGDGEFDPQEGNVRVAVFGKCLEEFSKHYGEVYEDGEEVTAQQAFSRVFSIIDNVMIRTGVLGVPDTADEITTAYALYLAGDKTIEYDTLSREVRGRGVTIDEFKDESLIKAWGNRLRVLSPEDRANTIEEKIGEGGITSESLTLIDKIHYCYYLFDNNKKLNRYLNEWQSIEFKQICEKLAENPNGREDPEIYERLSETGAIR